MIFWRGRFAFKGAPRPHSARLENAWREIAERAARDRKVCLRAQVPSIFLHMEVPQPHDRNHLSAGWSRSAKWLVSLLVVFHLAAVFIAPMSFASRPGSPAVDPLRSVFLPYIQSLYLDHGYAFFAPDPGPSHLVEFRLNFAEERPAKTGRFPSIREHYPRLLYHRHFMLSESLNTYYAPPVAPDFPPDMPPAERERELAAWRRARDQYEALRDSYARHLMAEHQAASVEVHRLRHDFLPPAQFTGARDPARPFKLDDARTYRDLDVVDTAPPIEQRFLPGITPLDGDER
jgi:hypothetical protein